MKIKKLLCTIIMLLLVLPCIQINALAESRNIYVGDIITLDITTLEYSEDELRQKFQDFEIVEVKKKSNGYSFSIRTFDVGERTILIGDKELVISVASTLDDISRDNIFEGETIVLKSSFPIHWRIILYITAGIAVLSGAFILVRYLIKKKQKPESAYQFFLRHSSELSYGDDNYFVKLTFYFKQYLESIYKHKIIGKTSVEIISELKEIPEIISELTDISAWLTECDMLKFSGIEVTVDDKKNHYDELLKLVGRIENTQMN